jgi:hypothetical protein
MASDMQADRTVAGAVQKTLDQACKEGDPQALLPSIIPLIAQRKDKSEEGKKEATKS